MADRFVVVDQGRAFDLASGCPVALVESSAGGPTEQARWVARCDRFSQLRHPNIARLLDFGVLGEARRFEAWHCAEVWRGAPDAGCAVDRSAVRFLAASGFDTGDGGHRTVRACDGRPVVLPGAQCGHEATVGDGPLERRSESERTPLGLMDCGYAVVGRRAVASLGEAFSATAGAPPRALALWGPPGAGLRTAALDLSRMARLQGFVPIRPSAVEHGVADVWPLVRGRSLFLVLDEGPDRGWSRVLECLFNGAKPDVVLFVGRSEVPRVDGMALDPIGEGALMHAVLPRHMEPALASRVERAAARAAGNPGTFVRLLWGEPMASAQSGPVGRSRAAESVATYGATSSPSNDLSARAQRTVARWPLAGELTALRRRLTAALEQVERGRHEPGCRALRQVVGGLARRHEWEEATRGGMALARALLRRGRARDASHALDEVQERLVHVERGTPLWVEAGVLSGTAAVDGGRLDDAERLLHTAVALAEADASTTLVGHARLALARCLFWRGRYDEARRVLEFEPAHSGDDPHSQAIAIHIAALNSRVAVGRGDAAAAVSAAVGALETAQRTGHASLIANAACASAFAHSAVGDRTAMDRDIALSVSASRTSRDTLCAMRARLVGAEHAARHGYPRVASALVERLSKLPAEHLPSTVRARRDLVADLIRSSAPRQDVVARHVGATALPGLAVFASGLPTDSPQADHMAVNDALEILRCCQIADDARAVLAKALGRLRAQLGASAMACLSPEGVILSSEGGRVEPRTAARVHAARQAITPHLLEGSVEGGAPVRYGGDAIAALVGRWAPGSLQDASRASMAMALAATAIGPAVAEVIASRRPRSTPGIGDLVGISPAIEEVRRAIERAAPAPFPVLVEGESGSGKELVARALHRLGPRRDRPFCSLNCAALPDELVESELFGHARGAFTGAATERPGVFEEAHTGTLFLDEVGELSPRAQAKVLRTIQEGELRRVGENINRRVDVRIVAATNRDLRSEVAGGRFRRDLLYRLDVVRIAVPPLRERREDIALLVERAWVEATARIGSRATLASATVCALADYDWPGNVRELQNVLAALAVRSPKRGVLQPAALPLSLRTAPSLENCRLDEARRSFEERFVRAALVRTAGHRLQAAEQLGVTRQGLAKLMTRLGIND